METWARSFGPVRAFGIEGTGSYGAGLTRFLQERGHGVIEVNRPNRQIRHQHGKTDPLDAENAARAVLSGQARAAPKSGTSSVEMIRHLKVTRDTAVKSRTQAMVTLKTIIINAPAALRESLEGDHRQNGADPAFGSAAPGSDDLPGSLGQNSLACSGPALADA